MTDKSKTVLAVAIIFGIFLILLLFVIYLVSGRKIVSPVPEESPIRIIILSPAPSPVPTKQ